MRQYKQIEMGWSALVFAIIGCDIDNTADRDWVEDMEFLAGRFFDTNNYKDRAKSRSNKRFKYPAFEKMDVTPGFREYASSHTVRKTAMMFHFNYETVRRWLQANHIPEVYAKQERQLEKGKLKQ